MAIEEIKNLEDFEFHHSIDSLDEAKDGIWYKSTVKKIAGFARFNPNSYEYDVVILGNDIVNGNLTCLNAFNSISNKNEAIGVLITNLLSLEDSN